MQKAGKTQWHHILEIKKKEKKKRCSWYSTKIPTICLNKEAVKEIVISLFFQYNTHLPPKKKEKRNLSGESDPYWTSYAWD